MGVDLHLKGAGQSSPLEAQVEPATAGEERAVDQRPHRAGSGRSQLAMLASVQISSGSPQSSRRACSAR
jgi:hypothetical protein